MHFFQNTPRRPLSAWDSVFGFYNSTSLRELAPSCWISRRYKRALTGTANGGRHKAMPCLAEEVLKAPVGQPAFQQLKGAAALYCQSPSLSGSGSGGEEQPLTPQLMGSTFSESLKLGAYRSQ